MYDEAHAAMNNEAHALMDNERVRRVAAIIALIAGFAVIGQFAISFGNAPEQGTPIWQVPINLYGYFTIWTNSLIVVVCGAVATGRGGLLRRPATLAAVLVYITVVGLVYNLLLVGLHSPTGFGLFVDTLLHRVVPVVYVFWWLLLVPRGGFGWSALLPALIVPTLYALVAMTTGTMTGRYAYPFLDVGKHGIGGVMINIAGLVVLFAGLMAVAIAWDRRAARRASEPAA